MNTRGPLNDFTFEGGFDSSLQPLDPRMTGKLAEGSFNIQNIDSGRNVPFGGLLTKGADTGSRILTTIGNTWGGIKDIGGLIARTFFSIINANEIPIAAYGYPLGTAVVFTTTGTLPTGLSLATTYYVIPEDAGHFYVATSYSNALLGVQVSITPFTGSGLHTVTPSSATVTATGSLFQDIGASIWGIGSGQPHIEGTDLTLLQLSSLLKVLLAVNGSYSNVASGAFVAGLSQPSSPTVAVMTTPGVGYTGLIDGAVSFKIARIRLSTGARSIASNTSSVIVPAKSTARVTFPLASTGQTYWNLFATQQGYGGVGIHYQLAYNGSLDIAESVIAASTVDGIARSIEIDYRDGDLLPIEAYINDYPPPAGTQAARVESSMVVFGCYSDSVSSPTSTDAGTCAAVSLPNYPESYKPRHILFFPEPVVCVLSRLIDSFCYVMCRNSIHAVQFVGWRDDLPSCTITTISPEVGVVHDHNVTQAYGRLFMWTERAGIVAMNPDGSLDFEFGAAIRKYTKDWTDAVVGFDAQTRSVTCSNGSIMFLFCLQSGNWSSPVYLSDFATGTIESAVTTRGEGIISINNSGSHTSYTVNQGGTSAPVLFASNFAECGTKKGKNIYEMLVSGEFTVAGTLFIGIHSNFRPRVFRDATTTDNSSVIGSALAGFTQADSNSEVFVFGADIGGSGTDYLIGKLVYLSANSFTITNLDGTVLEAQAALTGCTLVIANQVFTREITSGGYQDTYSVYPEIVEARQLSVTAYFETDCQAGQIFSIEVLGDVSEQSEINI